MMDTLMLTSRDNRLIRDYLKLASDSGTRRKSGRFVLEGTRLANDALLSGVRIEHAFFTRQAAGRHPALFDALPGSGAQVYLISDELSDKMADTQTTQGVLCTAFMLDKALQMDKIDICGTYLALENLQDPGNMGTILRTAEALGAGGVILSPGCVDVYSPKVIRSAMGAVFRLKLMQTDDLPRTLARLGELGLETCAAVARPDACDVTALSLHGGVVAVIGNEGNGLTQSAVDACGRAVTIRMRGRAESLNAASAAAILLWELTRRR